MRPKLERAVMVTLAMFACASAAGSELDVQKELRSVRRDVVPVVEMNRKVIADAIAKKWALDFDRVYGPGANALAVDKLVRLDAEQLYAAGVADTFGQVQAALAGQAPGTRTKALGQSNDLTYVPITPCRIVDTRYAGGAMGPGETREWRAQGSNFSDQGGSASNCNIANESVAFSKLPLAILANVTVANTGVGPAFLTAWAASQPQPNAASLNWSSTGQQVANAVTIPLGPSSRFQVFASSQTDVIVDVLGYFRPPMNAGERNLATTTIGALATVDLDVGCGLPPRLALQGSCRVSSDSVRIVEFSYSGGFNTPASVSSTIFRCEFKNESVFQHTIATEVLCLDSAGTIAK